MNVEKLLLEILQKRENLGYDPTSLNNPASSEDFNLLSGLQLNEELLELYNTFNGTKTIVDGEDKFFLLPSYIFMDIKSAMEYYEGVIEPDFLFVMENGKSPGRMLFPFLEDQAGNCFWVDLNSMSENYGMIFWTNTFGDPPNYLFNSLEMMLYTINECYDSGGFFLTPEGQFDYDLVTWGELTQKNNPNLLYWQQYNSN